MALQPIAAIAAFIALKMRDSDGRKYVMVEAKGRQLTSGRVENGVPIQPTYATAKVKVLKPPTKLCYKTARKHAFSDETKPKIQYGVVYYSADDDGRRQYTYPDGESPTGERERIAGVFPSRTQGYYICQYMPDNARPYNGTGIRGWFVLTPDNRGYAMDEDAAIAECNRLFNAKLEPQPTPVKPEEPPYTAPTQPDFGFGGVGTQFNKSGATGGSQKPSQPTPPPTGGQEPLDPPEEEPTRPLPPSEPTKPDPTKPTDPFKPPVKEDPFDEKPPMKEEEPDYKGGVDGMDKYGGLGQNGGGDYKLGGM